MMDLIVHVGLIKAELRQFIARHADLPVTMLHEENDVICFERPESFGIQFRLPSDAINQDGDYMTDQEKQDFFDVLAAIVDEHNNQLASS